VIKVAHVTTVHPRYDTRIFVKECRTLARYGYDVTLIVADGNGDEELDQVSILDIGASRSRLGRFLFKGWRMYRTVVRLRPRIVHLHDPELLLLGLAFRISGFTVVFDSHEDVPKQILSKHYIRPQLRQFMSTFYSWIERPICRRLDYIVCATSPIEDKFNKMGCRTVTVNNFPLLSEFSEIDSVKSRNRESQQSVCYVGALSGTRGIVELVKSMSLIKQDVKLLLGGRFADKVCEHQARAQPGWKRVVELGYLDREAVGNVMKGSIAGLCALQETPSYRESVPVKMFEYMASSTAVIASDFPYWRELLKDVDCAFFVNPANPHEIADAIDRACSDPMRALKMGLNGRKAVEQRFNWALEEVALLKAYSNLAESSGLSGLGKDIL
jgi:glycosyltransferase involved in cell wall biosynthesis